MKLTIWLLCWALQYSITLVNGQSTDVSQLTPELRLVWQRVLAEVNSSALPPRIEIVGIDGENDVYLFPGEDPQSSKGRYVFLQDINKKIDWGVSAGQKNPSSSWYIYDECQGSLTTQRYSADVAGFYLYSNNRTSAAVGVISVAMPIEWRWMNGTHQLIVGPESSMSNGSRLILGFEAAVYYNDNTDFPEHNRAVREIVRQANMSIDEKTNEIVAPFLAMSNLSCKRHSKIVGNILRVVTFVCMVDVVFLCPLETPGSSCWLDGKSIANFRLDIDRTAAYSEGTITVRVNNWFIIIISNGHIRFSMNKSFLKPYGLPSSTVKDLPYQSPDAYLRRRENKTMTGPH